VVAKSIKIKGPKRLFKRKVIDLLQEIYPKNPALIAAIGLTTFLFAYLGAVPKAPETQ
jgi:hypothetical protein